MLPPAKPQNRQTGAAGHQQINFTTSGDAVKIHLTSPVGVVIESPQLSNHKGFEKGPLVDSIHLFVKQAGGSPHAEVFEHLSHSERTVGRALHTAHGLQLGAQAPAALHQ